jgi:hypothetical protein
MVPCLRAGVAHTHRQASLACAGLPTGGEFEVTLGRPSLVVRPGHMFEGESGNFGRMYGVDSDFRPSHLSRMS